MIKPILDIDFLKKKVVNTLSSDHDLEKIYLEGSQFQKTKEDNLLFNTSLFKKIDLSDSRLSKLGILDSKIADSNLSNIEADRAYLNRVEIQNSRCTGFQITEGILNDVLFQGSKLDLSSFRFSHLKDVVFLNCNLVEASFVGANLENVSFLNCDLTGSDFVEGNLKNIDFRGSTLDNIRIDKNKLENVTVDTGQALYLTRYFGLEIKD
jgi:uncharacterized protein YjbI with pentapeptide repeats